MKVEAIPRNMTQGTANNPNGSTWRSLKNSAEEAKTCAEIDQWIKSAIDLKATTMPKEWHFEFKKRKHSKWVPLELFQETAKVVAVTVHDANEEIQKLEAEFNTTESLLRRVLDSACKYEVYMEKELEQVKQAEDAAGKQITFMNKEMLKLEKCQAQALKILNELEDERKQLEQSYTPDDVRTELLNLIFRYEPRLRLALEGVKST